MLGSQHMNAGQSEYECWAVSILASGMLTSQLRMASSGLRTVVWLVSSTIPCAENATYHNNVPRSTFKWFFSVWNIVVRCAWLQYMDISANSAYTIFPKRAGWSFKNFDQQLCSRNLQTLGSPQHPVSHLQESFFSVINKGPIKNVV